MSIVVVSPKDISTIRSELMRGAIAAMVRADAKAKAKAKQQTTVQKV